MKDLLLERPAPDFDELVRVLKGDHLPRRVHLVEVGIDPEILQVIQENLPWRSLDPAARRSRT